MKIFNWVHQRFHHSVLKDEIAGNLKTTELTTNETDKQALLKQVSHNVDHVLDNGWSDDILTIGTLGFDYPKAFNKRKEYLILQSEVEDVGSTEEEEEEEEEYSIDDFTGDDDSENVEHEELNPLMFETFGHNFEDFELNQDHDNIVRPEGVMAVDGTVPLTPFLGSSELSTDKLEKEKGEKLKKKGERITLADLFLADAHVEGKFDPKKVPNSGEKPVLRTKNGLSFAKKFIPRVKEDSRPIQTLQRLMKKMLKRKIHPEFDVKMQKLDGQKTDEVGPVTNGSLTLLPTQGATV
ncbi:uncharacterized protein LOC108986603 [Juglans regia]|uniref:Protein TILLER ANGLE CONTROL 1 n=2 Tax=Juglans regia TaxID=51240 RepID=A0A2I4E5Z9_JUGRE|nr:uncharacterized protein LOC108986603 [Juglans regia]